MISFQSFGGTIALIPYVASPAPPDSGTGAGSGINWLLLSLQSYQTNDSRTAARQITAGRETRILAQKAFSVCEQERGDLVLPNIRCQTVYVFAWQDFILSAVS